MTKTLVLSLGVLTALPALAQQAAPAPVPLTANLTLASEYRFRGIDQTYGKPAIQGGFDYVHGSGVYLGNWNSNVNQGAGYRGANIEMDFYGGIKKSVNDFTIDVGSIYYSYPGSDPTVSNTEFYVGGGWKVLSAKFFYALSDYFSAPKTKGTTYFDLAANVDLGNGWGVVAHFGYLDYRGNAANSYNDWKLGATKDFGGWLVGASYIATSAKGGCGSLEPYCLPNSSGSASRDAARDTVVFSVSRQF